MVYGSFCACAIGKELYEKTRCVDCDSDPCRSFACVHGKGFAARADGSAAPCAHRTGDGGTEQAADRSPHRNSDRACDRCAHRSADRGTDPCADRNADRAADGSTHPASHPDPTADGPADAGTHRSADRGTDAGAYLRRRRMPAPGTLMQTIDPIDSEYVTTGKEPHG